MFEDNITSPVSTVDLPGMKHPILVSSQPGIPEPFTGTIVTFVSSISTTSKITPSTTTSKITPSMYTVEINSLLIEIPLGQSSQCMC